MDIGLVMIQLNAYQIRGKAYKSVKNYIIERIQLIDTPVKMLHFEFKSDVSRLNAQTMKLLLDLQVSAGANVIEIPNIKEQSNYKKSIEKALEWKKANLNSLAIHGDCIYITRCENY